MQDIFDELNFFQSENESCDEREEIFRKISEENSKNIKFNYTEDIIKFNWEGYLGSIFKRGIYNKNSTWSELIEYNYIFRYLHRIENIGIVEDTLKIPKNIIDKLDSPLLRDILECFYCPLNFNMLSYAVIRGNYELVRILIEFSAKNVISQNNLNEALKLAVKNGNLEITQYLSEKGANIYCDYGYCLKWAIIYKHTNIINFLNNNGVELGNENADFFKTYNSFNTSQ